MSVASLDGEHLASFGQAMTNILSTPVAEFIFAQLVDGMPNSENYSRDHYYYLEEAPAMDHHELCPGSMEKTRAFLSRLHATSFKFDPKVSTHLGSRHERESYKVRNRSHSSTRL